MRSYTQLGPPHSLAVRKAGRPGYEAMRSQLKCKRVRKRSHTQLGPPHSLAVRKAGRPGYEAMRSQLKCKRVPSLSARFPGLEMAALQSQLGHLKS